jgi:hypothetical protein
MIKTSLILQSFKIYLTPLMWHCWFLISYKHKEKTVLQIMFLKSLIEKGLEKVT